MKTTTVLIAAIAVLFAAATAFALDHARMHQLMMKQGGPKSDDRTELMMPDPMKTMHKAIMRSHLDAIGEIVEALGTNNLAKAADISKNSLGWTEEEGATCALFGETVADKTKENKFVDLGKAMHLTADELAKAAKAGDKDKALMQLSRLVSDCNACHAEFRH